MFHMGSDGGAAQWGNCKGKGGRHCRGDGGGTLQLLLPQLRCTPDLLLSTCAFMVSEGPSAVGALQGVKEGALQDAFARARCNAMSSSYQHVSLWWGGGNAVGQMQGVVGSL